MFLNTEAIHSEPQRHISGNSPTQAPRSPLSIPLTTGRKPECGPASLRATCRVAFYEATHNGDLFKATSHFWSNCQVLHCKSKSALQDMSEPFCNIKLVIRSLFFFFFNLAQSTTTVCQFITLQKTQKLVDWEEDWRVCSRLDFISAHIILLSCVIQLLSVSYCAMSICFPYSLTVNWRVNSKSAYPHKSYDLLKPLTSETQSLKANPFPNIVLC